MRATHLELLQLVMGERYTQLKGYFEAIKSTDICTDHPIEETLFNSIFSPETCAKLFGTPGTDRSSRMQRKMDISIIRHAYHLWKDKNYFEITPKLCDILKDADLGDIDTFFLQTPYRSMYISLPKGNGFMVTNSQSGLHEIDSIYLVFDDYKEPHKMLIPNKNIIIENALKHIHMLVCGEIKEEFGDAILFFDLIFTEGKVSDSINKNKEILENPNLWPHIVDVFYFVVKILLYINCANVSIRKVAGFDLKTKLNGLKSPAKQRKIIQRFNKISPEAHSILDVVINHTHDITGSSGEPSHRLGPKRLERVRKHFKVQKFGAGRSQAKIILVDSYVRGEGADFYRDKKIYKVT
jgi:hypothetical protein